MSVLTRRSVLSWALYDWANSSFATTVMAGFFPIFFKQYWSAGSEATVSTFRLGMGNGVASAVIALIAPLLGAIADRGGARVKVLSFFTVLGVAMTAGLYWVEKGDWPLAVVFYALAGVGFWGGTTFYDSLLPDVAEERELDVVSSYGYALGYLGGGLLFLINVVMTLKPQLFGLADAGEAVRVSFLSVAVWWALFTIPLLLFVRERKPATPLRPLAAMRAGWSELWRTIGHLRAYRALTLFLVSYWLYIDGVNTIIKMAVDYGLSLGFDSKSLIVALLVTQFVAFPASLFFGWVGKRFGPRFGIQVCIVAYFGVTVWGYFLQTVAQFYTLAVIIGLVQGGIQSLSRSYFARLVPPQKSGEFFGFFNMMGKFAAVIGPMLMGWVALLTGSSRLAILSIALLFAAGAVLLWFVRPDAAASSPDPVENSS
ncbi:MAG TPA: MFS transporter [Steroidobacteraceae bacterium]|jgi:UMF1 family MFS transporter|nr:MFS transporter [Steroidobacteraceae bacterium]